MMKNSISQASKVYKDKMKGLVKEMLAHFDIRIVRNSYFESLTLKAQKLQNAQQSLNQFEIIKKCSRDFQSQAINCIELCRSQLGQDLFVLRNFLNSMTGTFYAE